jgi:phenylpropionate dioxygenase-like ring-hydroxylating dioxygenase large terminal subunit|tara:strand:- start:2807 stop:4018 length:1212 start_codon:yes stop_codon:yes gene_type:complete
VYINFWYPIILSKDLKPLKPEKIKVLGVNLVAFRGEDGQPHVLSDTCCHRGGSLGGNWTGGDESPRVINNAIVCPYHGWEFGGHGKCVNIPSIGYGSKVPSRARIDAYPVQEKYEIVFAFLGDLQAADRPPLLEIEEFDHEGWRTNEILSFDVNYYYERSVENGLDPAHNEFVHPTHGFLGKNRDNYKVSPIDVEDHKQGWGFWFMHTFDAPKLPANDDPTSKGTTPWGKVKTKRSQVEAGGGTLGPNALITHIKITPQMGFRQYFFEQPIDENKTRIFFINNRNFLLDPTMDDAIHERNFIIAQQDIDILDGLNPIQTPLKNKEEVLVPADLPIITYRAWLDKFKNKGWKIDLEKLKSNSLNNKAYSIPGPGRQQSKNYPIDSVPLVKKSQAERPVLRITKN